jgi:Tfp pilus assembly protein PilN
MINLLPKDGKKQLRAARSNAILRRYYMLIIISAVLLGAVFAVGFKVTFDQEVQYQNAKKQSEAEGTKYQQVRKAAEDFIKDLAVAKTILASDVRFSELITDIAGVIPTGVILSNLSLNTQETNAPLTINARAKTYDDAVKLKNSLEESPIFENVSLVNAGVAVGGDGQSAYPVTVSLSAKFSKKESK